MKIYLFVLLASFLVLYCSAASTGALEEKIRALLEVEDDKQEAKDVDASEDDDSELLKRFAKVLDKVNQKDLEQELEAKNKKVGELLESISHKKALEELARKRALKAQKENQDSEDEQVKILAKALLAKLEEKSNEKKNVITDFFQNIGQSIQQTFTGDEGKPKSVIDLPDDFPNGSNDPCKSPVYIDGSKTSSSTVDFPGAGKEYGRSQRCSWVFDAKANNKKIVLKFIRMNIEEDRPCDDYVQVYSMDCDSPNAADNKYDVYDQSGRLCYFHLTSQNATYPISRPCAYVEFRSDWRDQETGFTLQYAFV